MTAKKKRESTGDRLADLEAVVAELEPLAPLVDKIVEHFHNLHPDAGASDGDDEAAAEHAHAGAGQK